MLQMDGNFNPFAISNKHAHIINGNRVVLQCMRFFSHTSQPLRTINHFDNVLIVTLLQFFSHTKELLMM